MPMGLDRVEFAKCVQESFLRQYLKIHFRERAKLDLLLGNWAGQVGKPFGTTVPGPQVNLLNSGNVNIDGIRLAKVD